MTFNISYNNHGNTKQNNISNKEIVGRSTLDKTLKLIIYAMPLFHFRTYKVILFVY